MRKVPNLNILLLLDSSRGLLLILLNSCSYSWTPSPTPGLLLLDFYSWTATPGLLLHSFSWTSTPTHTPWQNFKEPIFVRWHVRFTAVFFKPLSELRYRRFSSQKSVDFSFFSSMENPSLRTINFKIKRGMKGTVVNQTCHGRSPELGLQSILWIYYCYPCRFFKMYCASRWWSVHSPLEHCLNLILAELTVESRTMWNDYCILYSLLCLNSFSIL